MKAWFGLFALAGVGFGVGFFAGERYGRKKEQDKVYDMVLQQTTTEYKNDIPKPIEKEANDALNTYANTDIPKEDDQERQLEEMNAYLAQFESPDDEEEDQIPDEKPKKQPINHDNDIVLVSEDVWETNTEYDPIELKYFDVDGVVTDEFNEQIDEAEDSIGVKTLEYFENYPDCHELYVQNNWTMEIFHISRVRDSYASAVLGMDEDFEFYRNEEGE